MERKRKSTGSGSRTEVIPLLPEWLTCKDACEKLGIGDRALRLAVNRGEVVSRRTGRTVRYRILRPLPVSLPVLPEVDHSALPVLPDSLPVSPGDPGNAERLARDLGEAVAIGWHLAGERDRLVVEVAELAAEVRRLQVGLVDLATSPGAVFLRRRMRALLMGINVNA